MADWSRGKEGTRCLLPYRNPQCESRHTKRNGKTGRKEEKGINRQKFPWSPKEPVTAGKGVPENERPVQETEYDVSQTHLDPGLHAFLTQTIFPWYCIPGVTRQHFPAGRPEKASIRFQQSFHLRYPSAKATWTGSGAGVTGHLSTRKRQNSTREGKAVGMPHWPGMLPVRVENCGLEKTILRRLQAISSRSITAMTFRMPFSLAEKGDNAITAP